VNRKVWAGPFFAVAAVSLVLMHDAGIGGLPSTTTWNGTAGMLAFIAGWALMVWEDKP
jgi:hypothetical protein